MGIEGLNQLYKPKQNELTESPDFSDSPFIRFDKRFHLCNKVLAIDSNNYLYRLTMGLANSVSYDDRTGKYDMNEIIETIKTKLIYTIIDLLNHNITPVFVFDGEAPKEKDTTRSNRRQIIENYIKRRDQLVSDIQEGRVLPSIETNKELSKLARLCMGFTREDAKLIKSFLDDLGLVTLTSTTEGEKLCCMLCKEKKVFAVVSNDSDCTAYNARYTITSMLTGPTLQGISSRRMRRYMDLDNDKFLTLCILLGCDYNTKAPFKKNIGGIGNKLQTIEWLKNNELENIHDHIRNNWTNVNLDICLKMFEDEVSSDICVDDIPNNLVKLIQYRLNDNNDIGIQQSLYDYYTQTVDRYNESNDLV